LLGLSLKTKPVRCLWLNRRGSDEILIAPSFSGV
jgi:hypothetical protein